MKEENVNIKFRILSAFCIIFVVAGHEEFGVFDVAGLFPYYSFHVGAFAFISGYFYKESAEENIVEYIRKKIKHLLIPYYVWNLIYGILITFLRFMGFEYGTKLTVKSLFFDPFLGGHQYGLNFAAWFVPVLFLIEVMNILMRKILELLHLKKELLIFLFTFVIGMMVVYFANRGSVWGYYKNIGSVLFLFPIYQLGQLYKKELEIKIEKIPCRWYFITVLLVQYIILIIAKGQVAYSVVWCTGFSKIWGVAYITTFMGIAFWLRISKLLVPVWKEGNLLDLIGKNTFSIMMHHVTGFFLLNTLYYFLRCTGKVFQDFNTQNYLSGYEYHYLPFGMESSKWLYLLFGIGVSLLISNFYNREIKRFIEKIKKIT